LPITNGFNYRVGDVRRALADIPDSSVAMVLTDPPYGNAAEPLYRWLAEWSARVLIPGGHLVVYLGALTLPRDIALLSEHLTCRGECVCLLTQHQRLFGAGLLQQHRAVLVLSRGRYRQLDGRLLPTLLRPKHDKSLHAWSQGDGGIQQFIDHLTLPGELIVEPFCGPGTWGRIVHAMGRRWTGCDLAMGGTTTIAA
jgi:hypothetical protein